MGRLAFPHKGRANVLPPPELLEPYIERTEYHWYWLGEFCDNHFDRCAEFRWAPPAEHHTLFMVPRLLWQLAHPGESPRLLENTCGLFTCINPGHWRRRGAGVVIPARIVLPGHVDATPVVSPSSAIHVHIRFSDTEHTVCGHGPKYAGLDKTAVITCEECISSWVRTGRPYTEVT
jgi:hypothetical protein